MSNRFHNKFHRYNHHTFKNPEINDSGYDPIASHENPFRGDFVLEAALSATLSAQQIQSSHITPWDQEGQFVTIGTSADKILIDTNGIAISSTSGVLLKHNSELRFSEYMTMHLPAELDWRLTQIDATSSFDIQNYVEVPLGESYWETQFEATPTGVNMTNVSASLLSVDFIVMRDVVTELTYSMCMSGGNLVISALSA